MSANTGVERVADAGLARQAGSVALPAQSLVEIRARTPARIFVEGPRPAYGTETWLELRSDHAAARDAVRADFELERDFGSRFVSEWKLFEVATLARTKEEFLVRPELGRSITAAGKSAMAARCEARALLQVAIADGLSAMAVRVQVPALLPLIAREAGARGWRFGQPFFIRHGRVGTLNDIGETLDPVVVVLLIGERPGLQTAESLSAYMAYRPRSGDDDSRRNLVCNIHARGVPVDQAAARIAQLAARMMNLQISGVSVKEELELPPALHRPAEHQQSPSIPG